MRDIGPDSIFFVRNGHALEPVREDPETHLGPTEVALEQDEHGEDRADRPTLHRRERTEVLVEVGSREGVGSGEARSEHDALQQAFDGSVELLVKRVFGLPESEQEEDDVHGQVDLDAISGESHESFEDEHHLGDSFWHSVDQDACCYERAYLAL